MDRKNYFSGAPMELVDGYSRMVQAGPFMYCGGTTSVQPDGSVVCEGESYGQVKYVLEKLIDIIQEAGGAKEDVYSVKIYATPEFDSTEGFKAYSELFHDVKPLLTCVTILRLTRPTQLVEIEMNAIKGSSVGEHWEGIKLERKNYASGSPLEEKLGYSRMVKIGPFVYVGGTTSVQPDGTVAGETATEQSDFIYNKQFDLLKQAGASPRDIVKIKKYVTESYYKSYDVCRTTISAKWDAITYSEVIIEKLTRPVQMVETEIFAIVGCGGGLKKNDVWGNIDFTKETKGKAGKFAAYVKVGPFLYGGLKHCVDEKGNMVGIGDSEKQESFAVSKFTEEMKAFGYVPEEMVKFKAYYTTDFGSLYGETEAPSYEKIYKPVKPLYTGVYVSRVGAPEEIFEMEMMAIKGAVEEKKCS